MNEPKGWWHPAECVNDHDLIGNCLHADRNIVGWREEAADTGCEPTIRDAAALLLDELGRYERDWLTSSTGYGIVSRAKAILRKALDAAPPQSSDLA